jgi:uncharacterized membrane protein
MPPGGAGRHHRGVLERLAGPFFVLAGAMHFVKPRSYVEIMPGWLPAQRELVYASGVAEIAGGLGLICVPTRRLAQWWLTATLLAVFPANLNMALHAERYAASVPGGRPALIARLPLQLAFVAWVRAAARRGPSSGR